jgi:hypothetical protein
MRIFRKLRFVLAACTLLGAGIGFYFWIYPLQFFPPLPAGASRAVQLRAEGFVYSPDAVYTLEFLDGGHQAIAEISPEMPTVSQRVYLGDAEYNTLSFSRNQVFLSVYRYQSAFGEAGGQLVDQIQLPQGDMTLSHIHAYLLQGAMPINTFVVGQHLWVQVRHLKDVPHSGFEVYNIQTGDYVTTVDLGEDYVIIDWVLDAEKKKLYAFGNSDYLLKDKSPYITNNAFKKKKTNYTVFFDIDLVTCRIQKHFSFDESLISISHSGLFYREGRIYLVSTIRYDPRSPTDREISPYPELLVFSPEDNTILTRTPLPVGGMYLQYHQGLGAVYFFEPEKQQVVGFDIRTKKIIQTFDVPGVRDMTIRGDYLYCNQRFLFLGNDYRDPPQISVWDLRTGKEVQRIPGVFGPFASQF